MVGKDKSSEGPGWSSAPFILPHADLPARTGSAYRPGTISAGSPQTANARRARCAVVTTSRTNGDRARFGWTRCAGPLWCRQDFGALGPHKTASLESAVSVPTGLLWSQCDHPPLHLLPLQTDGVRRPVQGESALWSNKMYTIKVLLIVLSYRAVKTTTISKLIIHVK